MVDALFELDRVGVEIGGQPLLDDVTLTIPDGGITVLLGPSGAGKSTLLRLLNRLEMSTSGSVRFRGSPVTTLDPLALRRRVGMVFQKPTPFPGTVRDNLHVARPRAPDHDLRAPLVAAGLDPARLDQLADDLSGGEAQRLCLARTLATDPEVLLLDEPTSSLDPRARNHLEATAGELAQAGRPIVWVTHDLDQAERLADHRIVLVRGRVANDHEVAHYLSPGGLPADHDVDGHPEDEHDHG